MNALTRMRTHMGVWALLALSMVISGCGGGSSGMSSMNGSSNPQTCMDCGNAIMTITDAQGQFTSYDVSVTSIQLKKANGAAVETLPKTTNIDFAQLVDLSEVLSAGQIPAGDYVAASISLDYTNATLIVDNGTTAGLKVSPVDSNGKAITTLTLDVQLDNKNHLVITPGQIARLALDFNLLASNTVDMNKATVTVQPILVASVTPADTKQIRVRGALDSVDTAKSQYVIDVMPFHEASSSLGQVTVHTTSTTTYEINGTSFTGAAGLQALAALKAGTMTAAFGTVQTSDKTFTAANVLAGTSLEDKNLDHLLGDVVARSGNSLTVRGIETGLRDGEFFFGRGNITVTVGPNTVVTEEGQTGKFDISAISV
ncbi:MAG TPA: DUF4382 domain-containing protein, partial [Steroidobacteraceae bacterium]|nr:DUF4382 domain-containing protein [Steroidobacteraceae bacterium]